MASLSIFVLFDGSYDFIDSHLLLNPGIGYLVMLSMDVIDTKTIDNMIKRLTKDKMSR